MANNPTEFYPQPNTFYLSGTVDSDLAIRCMYGDTYDGSGATVTIDGGSNQKFYLAQTDTPVLPRYGSREAELSSAHLAYFTNEVITKRSFHTPELKIYGVSPETEITEGSLNVIDDNLTVFSSFMNNSNALLDESFSGINKGFQDRDNYSKQTITAQTLQSSDFRYTVTAQQIYDLLSHMGEFEWNWAKRLDAYYFLIGDGSVYGGGPSGDAGGAGNMVFTLVNIGDEDGGSELYVPRTDKQMTTGMAKYVNAAQYGLATWIANGATANEKINLVNATYNVIDVEFVDRVTQHNSIFNYVREAPDAEDIKVQDVGDTGDSDKFFTYSKVAFDAGDKLTGGASAAFHCFWENWSGSVGAGGEISPYATMYGETDDEGALPQSAMAAIDYLPGPYQLDIGGPAQISVTGCNNPVTSPEIETTLKFEKMAPVMVTSGSLQTRLERGFSIIFAESYPEEDEDYMAYIKRLRSSNEVSTGLFFFAPRDNPAEKVYGIPFMNLISGAVTPAANSHSYSLMDLTGDGGRYFTSGAATSLSSYSLGGNRNYFEFPINQWLNLTFKYGPVNMFEDVNPYSDPTPEYGAKDYLIAYSKDITLDGAMQTVKMNLGDGHFGILSSGTQLELNAMSFWLNNLNANDTTHGVSSDGPYKNTATDVEGFTDDDMHSSVKLDRIAFKYFNWDVKNATVNETNNQHTISIPAAESVVPSKMVSATGMTWPSTFGLSGQIGRADNYFGQANTMTHSNICIGFDDKDIVIDPTGASGNIGILFNNFFTGNEDAVKGIPSKYVSGSRSGYENPTGRNAGQGVNGMNYFNVGGNTDTVQAMEQMGIITSGGTLSVDDFTQKGFIHVTGLINGSGTWGCRENIYASARVLGSNAEGTEIVVDNPSIFDLPIGSKADGGTDYIMWKTQRASKGKFGGLNSLTSAGISGSEGDGANALFQIKEREGSTIFLNRPTKFTDNRTVSNTLCTSNKIGLGSGSFKNAAQSISSKRQLGNIFISPRKYWLNLHICNVSDQPSDSWATPADSWGEWFNPAPDIKVQQSNMIRTFDTALATSGTSVGTLGSTWRESLITDGQYTRAWDLNNVPSAGVIQVETDYGYGAFTAPTDGNPYYGGFIQKTFPISGNYVYPDLSAYIKQGNVEWNSMFNFALYPMFESTTFQNYYTVNIDTKDGTNVPHIIWGVKDNPPVLSELTIGPVNQALSTIDSVAGQAPLNVNEVPSRSLDYVQLNWKEDNSEDIWYRFIIADSGPVFDKYHKASMIAHLNNKPEYRGGNDFDGVTYTNPIQLLTYGAYLDPEDRWTDYDSKVLSASGGATSILNGFMGYGAYVNGGNGTHGSSWNQDNSNVYLTRSSDKCSILLHCRPESVSGTIFELNNETLSNATGSALNISLSGGQVRANIYPQGIKGDGSSHYGITSTTFLSGTSYGACDGKEPMMIALTYDGSLTSQNWKLYVDGKLEDTADYVCATGAIGIRGSPYFGGQKLPASSNTGTGETDNNFKGVIEEFVGYNGIVLQFPQKNSFQLDTSSYRDFGSQSGSLIYNPENSNVFQARVFATDYHNIRGRTPSEIGMSNKAGWKVTGI